ncbi:Conserved_hypothetical protein [Hexamita inflata]|uniref:Uncharacterized protein n=1 Tax=Hexamita inflata TaxID=28002 RepID=A0AA86Q460_9EUKA|nr:Conserved hypothetical protein [Hexamita inflata]CAI9973810.1 Conserved hypothetical protein [Hexamita inflata]
MSSISTTFMAKENLKLQQFQGHKDDLQFATTTNALRDYDSIMNQLDELLILKETIRAQTAEIERLNAENNDYSLKITTLVRERDDALFGAQITEQQVAEQKIMIAKLLHAVKTATTSNNNQDNNGYGSLFHEFKIPHNFSKKTAIGFMGRFERMKGDNEECGKCCGEFGQQNNYAEGGDNEGDGVSADTSGPRIKTLETRIESIILEKDGITALLTKRISNLQASLSRMRQTLNTRLEQTEIQLNENTKQLIMATKLKTESDTRCLKLESDIGLLAAKGATAAQKARDSAKEAIRGARREIKVFELNREREIQKQRIDADRAHVTEIRKLKSDMIGKDRRIQEAEAETLRARERIGRLENRLRDLADENALVRQALKERLDM